MAFGGGNFRDYNKGMPGTYTNTITIGAPVARVTRGITAGGLKLDWGPDDQIFKITKAEFGDHPVDVTGYPEADDHNILIREIFKHADELVLYKLNREGGAKATHADIGEALYKGTAGNKIVVTAYPNINDESQMDISTYFDGILKDVQTIDKTSVEEVAVEIEKCGFVKTKSELATAVGKEEASFDHDDNIFYFTFKDKPADANTYVAMIEADGKTYAITSMGTGYKYTYFSLGANSTSSHKTDADFVKEDGVWKTYQGGESVDVSSKTVKLSVVKYDTVPALENIQNDTPKVIVDPTDIDCSSSKEIGSKKVTLVEAGEGGDASQLEDNNYVSFKKTGVIAENAGYTFDGGVSGSQVTAKDHSDMLAALEGYTFNTLFCDTQEDDVKAVYVEFTKRLRDERGIYFQTVVQDYVDADYEGVISVNNVVKATEFVNKSSLVCWVAGYSSNIPLNNELTSKLYDGELVIDVSKPDIQNEMLFKQGHFLFHKVSMDENYTLIDVNTLTTFTTDHNKDMSQNKVVRIVDYIHNEEAYLINRVDIGSLPNTPEGRTSLWNQCVAICEALQADGAIKNFTDADITVSEIEGQPNAVKVDQRIQVVGTIRYVYITTYVIGE